MPRPIRNLTDMEIDEISTVDKTANQHSRFVIAKRAPEEDEMPKLYNQEGQPLDEDQLEFGDIVYDDEGTAYEYVEDDGEGPTDEHQEQDEGQSAPELATVGKSAFFEKPTPQTGSFSAAVMEELSKAYSDKDRDQVIAKALGRVEELEGALQENARIAKSERDLRLTREYISKAAEYNLPIAPEALGPVLYRMAETMSYDDCAVIAKALETAGEIIFEEQGYTGGGDNTDILSQVEAHAYDTFGKAENFDAISAVNTVFDQNPDAYDEYLRQQQNR
jgi:hypothetical protein